MTTLKLEQYINFDSLEELNYHVALHVKHHQLNDTQYKLLTVLSQHSVKYLGASYLKLDTLCGLLDVSKSTVQRALRALAEKGIIVKEHTFRPVRGGFGATIFVIQQYPESTHDHSNLTTCDAPRKSAAERLKERLAQKETASSKSKYNNSLVTKQSSINREHNLCYKDVVPSHIPLKLGEHMIKFFDSATVNRLYQAMTKALSVYDRRDDYGSERLSALKYRGFNALVLAIKNHMHNPHKYPEVKNIYGYLYQASLNIAVRDEFEFL